MLLIWNFFRKLQLRIGFSLKPWKKLYTCNQQFKKARFVNLTQGKVIHKMK